MKLSAIVAWFAQQEDQPIDLFEVKRVFGQVQDELAHLEGLGILKVRDVQRRYYRLRIHPAFQISPAKTSAYSWGKKQQQLKEYREARKAA